MARHAASFPMEVPLELLFEDMRRNQNPFSGNFLCFCDEGLWKEGGKGILGILKKIREEPAFEMLLENLRVFWIYILILSFFF